MENKKPMIILLAVFLLIVILVGIGVFMTRDVSKSNPQANGSGSENKPISRTSNNVKVDDEANYKVESKSDAQKALSDVDGFVKSTAE